MKAAIYIRVSTSRKQEGHEKEIDKFIQNPEVQLLPLKKLCEAREFELVEVYQDRMSGAKEDRPGYKKLWKDARAGKFKIVLVWRFDRFARSTKELLQSLEEFRVLKIDFFSLNESVDTSTPMGRLVFTFLAAIAEFERELIRERIYAGLSYAKEKGTKSGKAIGRPKRIVRRDKIIEMALAGMSEATIVMMLSGEGIKISKSTVHRIIGVREKPKAMEL